MAVQHVGNRCDGMPVIVMRARKRPEQTFRRDTARDDREIMNVPYVINIQKIKTADREINGNSASRHGEANRGEALKFQFRQGLNHQFYIVSKCLKPFKATFGLRDKEFWSGKVRAVLRWLVRPQL